MSEFTNRYWWSCINYEYNWVQIKIALKLNSQSLNWINCFLWWLVDFIEVCQKKKTAILGSMHCCTALLELETMNASQHCRLSSISAVLFSCPPDFLNKLDNMIMKIDALLSPMNILECFYLHSYCFNSMLHSINYCSDLTQVRKRRSKKVMISNHKVWFCLKMWDWSVVVTLLYFNGILLLFFLQSCS